MQPGPQWRRLARLPPPERFPVAIKAPFVSAWSWSRSLSRRDWEGRGKRLSAGFFSWRRPCCSLLATLTSLRVLLASPRVWALSVSLPFGLYSSLSSCLGL